MSPGFVSIVGAGPGDPDLLTVKARRAVEEADVVLHDALVPDSILALAVRAVRVPVGKRAGRRSTAQESIHRLLVKFARRGRRVVRLKGGDPFVFGRSPFRRRVFRSRSFPVSAPRSPRRRSRGFPSRTGGSRRRSSWSRGTPTPRGGRSSSSCRREA